jgi:hypothetical protein
MTAARAVIAPVDNEAWLPRGLARQLRGWLQDMGVTCVTPKPLCSLTETNYSLARRKRIDYDDPWISEFARYFGQPDLHLTLDPKTRTVTGAVVVRDAVCGCARHVAQGLEFLDEQPPVDWRLEGQSAWINTLRYKDQRPA